MDYCDDVVKTLREARALISDENRWGKGAYARASDGAETALYAANAEDFLSSAGTIFICREARDAGGKLASDLEKNR